MTLLWKYKQKHAFVGAQSRQGFLHRVQGVMVAAHHYLLVYLLDYPMIFGTTSDNYAASVTHLSYYVKNIEPLSSIFLIPIAYKSTINTEQKA
jgi:hypothetical protein